MYLVVCSDAVEKDNGVYNTAFLLDRDGKEIGRYHKVSPTWCESGLRSRGRSFPVFATPDLGTVGMAICYDLVMPETARCLALGGADVICYPTMGTAAIGDGDIGVQALRVRAVENFVWLIVAHRGSGAMIISPQGRIVSQADGPDGFASAEIDPLGSREGGDSSNWQRDMRARLFRERNPQAYARLIDTDPPILAKVPLDITPEEAGRIMARMLTVGEQEFRSASELLRSGELQQAIEAFQRLQREYKGTWIDRVSTERLKRLQDATPAASAPARTDQSSTDRGSRQKDVSPTEQTDEADRRPGIARLYPGDLGISQDPRVVFAEDFETGDLADLSKRWTEISNRDGMVLALDNEVPPHAIGRHSLQSTATLGKNTGGHLYRRLPEGFDKLHVRYYVKFPENSGYVHHFTALGGYHPPTDWPQGGAGTAPRGDDRIYIGIEPHNDYGRVRPPGHWSFYNYWHEMKRSADGRFWGNAISPQQLLLVPKNRWQCVEVMAKLNSAPDQSDGELSLWLDGELKMHVARGVRRGDWSGMGFKLPSEGGEAFEGFRWRTDPKLQLNFFWLLHYVTDYVVRERPEDGKRDHRVWFDNIVIATEYIGPLATR
jgi:hypothetical protein